jgi:hypothetical protein
LHVIQDTYHTSQAKRLQGLEVEMGIANAEYLQAVKRASEFASFMTTLNSFLFWNTEDLHSQMFQFLRMMLEETNMNNVEPG